MRTPLSMPVHPGFCRCNSLRTGGTVEFRHATGLALLVTALIVLPGCRLGGSRAAVLKDSNSRVQLANAKAEDVPADSRAVIRHADGTRDRDDDRNRELVVEDDGGQRPSRWSRLIDRLRPARRIPLPLSSDDPETTLHEQLTAF